MIWVVLCLGIFAVLVMGMYGLGGPDKERSYSSCSSPETTPKKKPSPDKDRKLSLDAAKNKIKQEVTEYFKAKEQYNQTKNEDNKQRYISTSMAMHSLFLNKFLDDKKLEEMNETLESVITKLI